jgi:hypothetical protein
MKLNIPFILIFIFSLCLSGCLNYTQITTIKTDGSGNMFIHYYMKWNSQKDSSLVEQLGIFNKDSVYQEFLSNYSTIKNVEVYKDLADSTIHAKVEFVFNSLDSLNNTRAFKNSALSIKEGPKNTKIFSQFIPPIATGFGIANKSFSCTYIYYLPGEILSHNATEISNNKLTWQYSLNEVGTGKQITATYRQFKLKETPIWIYMCALFVLVIVVIYVFSKRIK